MNGFRGSLNAALHLDNIGKVTKAAAFLRLLLRP